MFYGSAMPLATIWCQRWWLISNLKSGIFCRILVDIFTRSSTCPLISRCHRIFNMNFKTSLTCYCVELRYYICFQVSHGQNRANHTPHFLINGFPYHLTMQGTPNISCHCFFFLCSITFAPTLLDTRFILNSLCHSDPFCVHIYLGPCCRMLHMLNLHK